MCGFIALLVTVVSIMLLYRVLINQNARFRKQCNAFFIDLVSTLCFKDNSPPCRAIILHLLSFLMVKVHSVPIIRGGEWVEMGVWAAVCLSCGVWLSSQSSSSLPAHRQILTKALSPFDDSVDKNPVVRSVVLKLLLKYR